MPISAFFLELGHSQKAPLAGRIYLAIRGAIETGSLGAGARLPSWTDLAARLWVFRGTVCEGHLRLFPRAVGGRLGGGGHSPPRPGAPVPCIQLAAGSAPFSGTLP